MRFGMILILLVSLACSCSAQSYRYSFEGTFEGWMPDACDDMPGPNWRVILTKAAHVSGAWSLEYYIANYNDATKVWIEKPFLVALGQTYTVQARWYFASSDRGDFNLWNIIASISGSNPETKTDFNVIGGTLEMGTGPATSGC